MKDVVKNAFKNRVFFGISIPCAAHVPPRFRRERKAEANANLGFLQQLMHLVGQTNTTVPKSSVQEAPKPSLERPNPLKIEPRAYQNAIKTATSANKTQQEAENVSKKRPRAKKEPT